MPRTSSPFTTIRSEGALLPPEVLGRITDADKDLGGLAPTDYHLGETERLGEAISRSWNRLVGIWASFAPTLEGFNANDPGTGATRERWLAPLVQELGFGRLQVAKARDIDGVDYPISHEWGPVPVHLVGAGVELERRTKGVAGAARMSPHALVQDYLNRTEGLWGVVSNGRELRVLRDNVSLTRQTYLAFDLQAMFSGEVYADFFLLWLICHESRFEPQDGKAEGCWLERWTQAAQSQGTRALNTLRDGVEHAIATLGAGFVTHPANAPLRESLRAGELPTAEFYRELLRLIYRLIFLFVAEDRGLLHPEGTPEEARGRYLDYYSMTKLRKIAERLRGGPHSDLWRSLVFVCSKLALDEGCPELGLPYLGSSLFSPGACPHLDAAELANRNLLGAIRALAFTQQNRSLRAIDYRNMGSEELGSIYESLLELHPEVHLESGTFELATAAGNERKTTGSYYTPTSLISALLDTALDPMLDEAAAKADPETAILELKVLDPAAGSGHFLVAGAHRIAKRLAATRTDEPEPSPDAYRHALRDVISRCIFGIDVNPMATELCRVSLWMEAMEPGKPLSFLDHHIVCGNSLLGTTPALLAHGIPDEAFAALEGDDKETVKSLKKRNKEERKGQASLFGEAAHPDLVAPIAEQIAQIEAQTDGSPKAVKDKERKWASLQASREAAHAKLIADSWCAAFVIDKTKGAPVLTQGVLEFLERDPSAGGDSKLPVAIAELATRYRFLHPHLAFPQVFRVTNAGKEPDNPGQGWFGGFDVVVGNPPWERVKLQEKEWFAAHGRPDVAAAPNATARKRRIAELRDEDPTVFAEWVEALRQVDGESHLLRRSARYPLTGQGDINTYAVFAEGTRGYLSTHGRAGLVVPSGLATDATTAGFFADLIKEEELVSLFDFVNDSGLFPGVGHGRQKFCLLTIGRGVQVGEAQFAFFLHLPSETRDPDRQFSLGPHDFVLLNPNTLTCPVFSSRRDAEITRHIYETAGTVFIHEPRRENPWNVSLHTLFHMANDSHLFGGMDAVKASSGAGWMPLYEGKMIHQFNHRFGDYAMRRPGSLDSELPPVPVASLTDPAFEATPQYWIGQNDFEQIARKLRGDANVVLRRFARATDERTVISTVLPTIPMGDSLVVLQCEHELWPVLPACLNSFVFDFAARQKLGGTNLSHFVIKQLPVLPPDHFLDIAAWDERCDLQTWISKRVLELVFTSHSLAPFGRLLRYEGPPFRWDAGRRALIRTELDAAFFHLYGLGSEEVGYVMDTFSIVRRNDEKTNGEFRTKREVLERFSAMARAVETGQPYETPLVPPPAYPRVAQEDGVER
jgi:hypothetical protein